MRWVRSVLVLLVGLAVFAAPATAAIKTPFRTTLALGQPGDPERAWESGPILHVRGEPNEGTVAGDLNGPASIVNNYNLDPRRSTGRTGEPSSSPRMRSRGKAPFGGPFAAASTRVRSSATEATEASLRVRSRRRGNLSSYWTA
jgi:hypothetical protein